MENAHNVEDMIFLYLLLAVYILSVNFCAFMLVKRQQGECELDGTSKIGDAKLLLAGLLGGATAIYVTMFILRFRLSNLLLMILLPIMAVFNFYLFYLGFRSIYFFW